MDPYIILRSALEGAEISTIEALFLMQQEKSFIPEIFQVADEINKRYNGNTVTYVNGCHVSYTNICRACCRFCSYFKKKGEKGAYSHTIDSILAAIKEHKGATEVCIQGGLNTEFRFNFFKELFENVTKTYPSLHIHALSPAEIYFLSKRNRMGVHDILSKLKTAGLDTMPGTAAEILNDKLRKKICPDKLRTNDWVDIVKTAHKMEIKTSTSMLMGHVEDEIYVSEHLEIVRNIQKDTGGVTEFLAIPFVPENTLLAKRKLVSNEIDWDEVFRIIAVSRIYFGQSIKNIQLNWRLVGLENALHGCTTGVNDIGNVVASVHKSAKPRKEEKFNLPSFSKSFSKINKQLRQRDSLYKSVSKSGKPMQTSRV